MEHSESHLEQADRHVREGGERIARHKELIEKLRADDHEELLPDAEQLLRELEEAQRLSCEHLAIERADSETNRRERKS